MRRRQKLRQDTLKGRRASSQLVLHPETYMQYKRIIIIITIMMVMIIKSTTMIIIIIIIISIISSVIET